MSRIRKAPPLLGKYRIEETQKLYRMVFSCHPLGAYRCSAFIHYDPDAQLCGHY